MSNDYYVKYLKYKNKYLSLKGMAGGADNTEIKNLVGLLNENLTKYTNKDSLKAEIVDNMYNDLVKLKKEIEKWKTSHEGAANNELFTVVGITEADFSAIRFIYLRTCFYVNDGTLNKTKALQKGITAEMLKKIAFETYKLLYPDYNINDGLCARWDLVK
jgi:hypothetical protein